jgi:hypothetical protein
MLSRKSKMLSSKPTKLAAVAGAVIAIGGGAYGIVSATASTTASTASAATSPVSAPAAHPARGEGGNDARSGPAAGGSTGTVESKSASGFMLRTSAGQKVTVQVTASTAYWQGTKAAPASGVTTGESVLVLGTTNSTMITASRVIVQPTLGPKPSWAGTVVPFTRGTQSASKQAGQIPAAYTQGTGTIVSGTAATKATRAALAIYPGGIIDRVVKLSNGEYEVHYIGVNWPHHIFVNQDFKVIGAD